MPAAQAVEKVDSQKAAGNGSGKQPHQVGSVDLSNRSGHQQEAESHLQNGFDRHDELEGKEEGQQRDAQQRPSETRKGPEEKGKQHDGLGSQQGWIHGIAGRRRPNGVSTGSPPPISGKSPARRCRSGCEPEPAPSGCGFGAFFDQKELHLYYQPRTIVGFVIPVFAIIAIVRTPLTRLLAIQRHSVAETP